MNANDMLDVIGEIKGSYVLEAQRHREGRGQGHSKLRLLLVAAILAALLTGCAVVYALRLETMKVGVMEIPRPRSVEAVDGTTSVKVNILSIQGIQGSPNYNAAREWFDFQQSYQQELGVLPLTEEEEKRYISYACYDRAMADKLDEICQKYGLELHGEWFHEVEMEEAYKLLGIDGILREEPVEAYERGMFFQDGSFRVEGGVTPASCPWPHPVSYAYQYTRKQFFDDVVISMGDAEVYEQWIFQTRDGSELLLALGPGDAMIFADQQEAFVSLMIGNDDYPQPFDMEKSELEAVAELFDFTIRPQALNEANVETARRLEKAAVQARMDLDPSIVDNYKDYAKYYLSSRDLASETKMEYAICDTNDDGTEELVILRNRTVQAMVTMQDGKPRELGCNGRPWIWCEGNLFVDRFNYGDYGGNNHDDVVIIRRFEGVNKIDVRQFQHFDSQQWRELDPFTDLPIADLTDEQFRKIMDTYPPIDLDALNLKPLESLAYG